MTILIAVLSAVALFWLLAYRGAKLWLWTVAATAYVLGLQQFAVISDSAMSISLAVILPLAALFNIKALRRAIVTRPIFKAFKAVLPDMTDTEREALEAGDVWWEGEMFRGKPNWQKLLDFKRTELTAAEAGFLQNETETLCAMIDDWQVQQDKDLPEEVWSYMREHKFFAMLIAKEWGGLGFSAYAQSCVVTKIATRSLAASVTVMVPNSLGPGELLMHYGTQQQKEDMLPKLASGEWLPCFGLTGPEAGSDAGALPDTGVVCMGEHDGEEVLGMRLNFSKRYITLAPVSDVVGLAIKLYDPEALLGDADKNDYGITCVLVPSDYPGVEIGRRHNPCNTPFMNGPINGQDIFVPIDFIIGGQANAGKGWRMLVECLSAGRGISLPALAAAASKAAYRTTGAYTRIRRQFKTPIGKFEGVQEASSRIAGYTYKLEATRALTASAVDHCSPSVVTAIAKYHMTDMMRTLLTDAMDIHGGRGVMAGPSNYLQSAYQAVPIAITVEGANILTRNLMIFGQGAIRCHPYVFPEMEAAREDDLVEFDQLLWSHIGFSINRGVRALSLGLTGARLANSPLAGPTKRYFQHLERLSSALAFTSDVTMGVLGGELKRKERLSARLGDVLSQLYMASATLKYFHDEGATAEDIPYMQWVMDDALAQIDKAFDEFFSNFPVRPVAALLRFMTFPLGRSFKPVSDHVSSKVAEHMMTPSALRDRLTAQLYLNRSEDDPIGSLEMAFDKLIEVEPVYNRFVKEVAAGATPMKFSLQEQLDSCVAQQLISQQEAEQIADFDRLRLEAILVDAFDHDLNEISRWQPHGDDERAAA
ncbi:MAG: acyl-CoA dehydrogenase [Oceanococcus sp.]